LSARVVSWMGGVLVRSRVQKISPEKAIELLAANTANRPFSRSTVQAFAEAMRRGDWLVTHQAIAVGSNGVLVDGQHRLAAVIEADLPVEMTVFTEVEPDTFDVLDTGRRRNAADVLAIEGEKSTRRWRRWCGRCGSSRTGRRRPGPGVGRR
jgi:hypothetical protein